MARLPNDQDSSSSSSPSLSDEDIEQIDSGGGDGSSSTGGLGDIRIPEDELPSDQSSESESATQESAPADLNQGRRATDPTSSASSTSSGSSGGGSNSGGQDTTADIASPEPNTPADLNQGRRATDPTNNSNEQTTSSTGSESQPATADAEIVNDTDQQNTATVADPQGGQRDIQEESLEQRAADQAGQAVSADEVNVEVDDEGVSDVTVREAVPDVADQKGGQRDIQEESLEASVSEQAGNAVSSDEVDVSVSDEGLEDVSVNETTPNVADQQGGQRDIQEESLEQAAADSLEGVDASGVDAELSDTGGDISLNRGGARDLREAQTSLSPNERAKFEGAETATMAEDPVVEPVDRSGNKKSNAQQVTEAFSIASAADRLAGKTDEAVGRTIEGFQNVADARGELNAGERLTAYARITTRNTFGRGAEDLAFQGDFAGNQDDIDLSGGSINSSLGGNGDLIVGGGDGSDFGSVTDSLTAGKGLFSDDDIQATKQRAANRQEQFGLGDEAAGLAEDLGAGEKVQSFARGVGNVPGEFAAAPSSAAVAADTATEAAVNAPRTVNEFGGTQTAGAVLDVGGQAADQAASNPYRTAGSLAGEFAAGTAAIKGVEAGARGYRAGKLKARAGAEVELDELTDKPANDGDLPEFETGRGEPTSEAVRELQERAGDQPDNLQSEFQEDILMRSDDSKLPDDIDAERGSSELPGLFASPDLSTLRLKHRGDYSDSRLDRVKAKTREVIDEGVSLQLTPDLSGRGDSVTMFPGDDIRAMPDDATGSGRIPDPDADADDAYVPDPETSGARFLDNDAEAGAAYARPTGSRTTELEAIYPPGSQFQRAGTVAVRLPDNRLVEARTFRRADSDSRSDTTASGADADSSGSELPDLRGDDNARLQLGTRRRTNDAADETQVGQADDSVEETLARRRQDTDADADRRVQRDRTSDEERVSFRDLPESRVSRPDGPSVTPTVVPGADTTTGGDTSNNPTSGSAGGGTSLPGTSGSAPERSPLSGSTTPATAIGGSTTTPTSSPQSSGGSGSGVTDVPGFPTSPGGGSGGSVGGGSGGSVGGGSGGSVGGGSGGGSGSSSVGGTGGSSGASYGFSYTAAAAPGISPGIVPTPDSGVDDKERFPAVAGADASKLTDFVDPLSGGVLETRDPRRRPDSPL